MGEIGGVNGYKSINYHKFINKTLIINTVENDYSHFLKNIPSPVGYTLPQN